VCSSSRSSIPNCFNSFWQKLGRHQQFGSDQVGFYFLNIRAVSRTRVSKFDAIIHVNADVSVMKKEMRGDGRH
jgi:hypothetical protein